MSETLFEKLRFWTLKDLLHLEDMLVERQDAEEGEDEKTFYCPSLLHFPL
ncbi:hypothetical protein [Desulfosoma sp.]